MKILPLLPLVLAGAVLGYVGHRAGKQTYVPLTLGAETEATPTAVTGEVPEGMVVQRFRVTGMCCEGCVGKLYSSLAAVDGVERAGVDFNAEIAEALVPVDTDLEPLLAALSFDKYAAEPQ